MDKISVNLENCFGIKKINETFDFTESKVNLIYAKNGSMKTSFAKVFEKIQLNKKSSIKDLIHNKIPITKELKVTENIDGEAIERDIEKEDIFVIRSFVPSYESENIATLLIDNELKQKISEVFTLKENLLKFLEKRSDLKITTTSQGETIYRLEPQILKDFSIENQSFLKNLCILEEDCISDEYKDTKYNDIFDAYDIITSTEFQDNIESFLEKSNEVYDRYNFLSKWEFTLAKLKKVQSELGKQSFFVQDNKLKFDNIDISKQDLDDKVSEIEEKLQETDEFKKLEKLLQKPKWIPLKDIIENSPSIIEKLKTENLENFKKELWQCYTKESGDIFNNLKRKFSELESEISELDLNETLWKGTIDLFNDRFFLPFRMDISNVESSIMWESLPKVIFKFPKDGNFQNTDANNWTELDRKDLEKEDVLSQWERRALYLLNIIFEIEVRKNNNQKTIFIIDDIADSFDYKNKYAIVEYLKDLSLPERDLFYSIILTHNFDFFRFVRNRLNIKNQAYEVSKNEFWEINLIKSEIDEPWKEWKRNITEKTIIALIPFVRNLIEYGNNKQKSFLTLTHLLHKKVKIHYKQIGNIVKLENIESNYDEQLWDFFVEKTEDIDFETLEGIYQEYLWSNINFDNLDKTKSVYSTILTLAEQISEIENKLEDKIILAITIRLIAEDFMKREIEIINSSCNINYSSKSQFRYLYEKYLNLETTLPSNLVEQKEKYKQSKPILEKVSIMTPENIHLNSFMYEPILDMDIVELKNLYSSVKNILSN